MIFIICLLIGVILLFYLDGKSRDKCLIEMNKKINELNNIFDKVILLGYEDKNNILNYVGFDNTIKTIIIKNKGFSNKIINYNDINMVEFISNGQTVISVGSIIGGAVLAGGTGAIIGGMNKKEKIISEKIKFTLNNFNNPSFEIDLMNTGKTSPYHISLYTSKNEILDTVKYIIENK